MQVSLQSKVYLGTCVAIGAYNAYTNPTHWITVFAFGVLYGTLRGRSDLRTVREGFQTGNNYGMGWTSSKDREVRENAVRSLTDSMPGLMVTALNLLALGLISQRIQWPSGWNPLLEVVICDVATYSFGVHVGTLFQLDILRRDQHPMIQKLLANAVI